MKKIILIFIICLTISGCAGPQELVIIPHRVGNVALDPVIARSVRSVAVFPIHDPEDLEGVSERLAEIISLQILKIGRFKIIEPTKVRSVLEQQRSLLISQLTVEEMLQIGNEMKVDAIIYGQLLSYRPHQFFPERLINRDIPAIVGLNLKMITVKKRHIAWAASDIFNGGDETIAVLVPPEERWKTKLDIDFLSSLLVRELVKTLNF